MEDHSAPQQLDAEELVKRYEVYAEIMGRQRDRKDKNDSDEHPVYKQAAFSLLWFYRNLAQPGSLNLLSQAFLGDEGAQLQLSFGEAPEASFSDALLEGKYPLNASQRRAIARALKSDISLIQGPPGTGKTEVILNLASCIIGWGKNVAVVANNGKAIDNITEKIAGWRKHPDQAGPNQRRLVESYARLGGKDARKEWVAGHQDAPDAIRFRTGVKKYDGAVLPNKVFARYGGRWLGTACARSGLPEALPLHHKHDPFVQKVLYGWRHIPVRLRGHGRGVAVQPASGFGCYEQRQASRSRGRR